MNPQPTQPTAAAVPAFEEPQMGVYVYLCERCGQPLDGPHDLCNSALHVSTDGLGVGHAVRSTELARLAGAARAGLGGWR
jgi:hypothetical protein